MRFLPILVCIGACAQFPALDGTISDAARNAPYPQLSPLSDVPAEPIDDGTGMQARIAALQARAQELRETDITALQ